MFKVEDIMTTNLITVTRDTLVGRAMKILTEKEITGMPVVDDDMKLVGIISEKDVLELLHDIENNDITVEEYMTTDVVSFEQDTNLIDICDFLTKKDFRRVPITLRGKLVGILTRKDIIRYIVDYQDLFKDILPECSESCDKALSL